MGSAGQYFVKHCSRLHLTAIYASCTGDLENLREFSCRFCKPDSVSFNIYCVKTSKPAHLVWVLVLKNCQVDRDHLIEECAQRRGLELVLISLTNLEVLRMLPFVIRRARRDALQDALRLPVVCLLVALRIRLHLGTAVG